MPSQASTLKILLKTQARVLKNIFKSIRRQSFLKLTVIFVFLFIFWIGAYFLFYYGFHFLLMFPGVGLLIVERILGLAFAAIFFMLAISSAISAYSGLYRSREVSFLLTLPVEQVSIFSYKAIESAFISSWSVVFLVLPLLLAYANVQKLGFLFFFFSFIFSLPFVLLAAAIGTIFICLAVRFFPKQRLFRWLAVIIVIALVFSFQYLRGSTDLQKASSALPYQILNKILSHTDWINLSFLPNYWLTLATLGLAKNKIDVAVFYLLLLLSNFLFSAVILDSLGRRFYYSGWIRSGLSFKARVYKSKFLIRIIESLKFLKKPLQAMLMKDIKIFFRDPRQWLQFAVFFGFIFVYILNLRTMPFNLKIIFWKNLISLLNLSSISLTTAMLNIRFIFPAISLEGMRFWVLGLAPLKLKELLFEKWLLSFSVSVTISVLLMFFSGIMLGVSGWLLGVSLITAIFVSLGVSGLSVGLGAAFPNFKEDNPNVIISGFGGTLLLVLSLGFVGLIILAEAFLLLHGYALWLGKGLVFFRILWVSVIVGSLSILSCILPLRWGLRRLERMEF